ncbi:hypothetical protein AAVH_08814 [Aphelenchoides avenae]|nr:hypothetical protein AAVH_08814 [Aphelenchus avenae]
MLSGLVGANLSGIVQKLDDHFTLQPGVYKQLPCGKLNFRKGLGLVRPDGVDASARQGNQRELESTDTHRRHVGELTL